MSTLPWPYEAILVAGTIIALAIRFVAWRRNAFFRWKTISNRLLTEKGLAYRRKMVQSVVLFFIAGFAFAVVLGFAKLASR